MAAQPAHAQWRAGVRTVDFDRMHVNLRTYTGGHTRSHAPVDDGYAAAITAAAHPRLRAARARSAAAHARMAAVRARMADKGDLRLMFLGGVLGAAAGYLVGDAAHSGITSVMDVRGASTASYSKYLAALPAAGSALGAVMGAGTASCVKFHFGSLYRLDSCADTGWMILGALPGAVLSYAFRAEGMAVTAGAVLLEALGSAIAGRLARNEREALPEW